MKSDGRAYSSARGTCSERLAGAEAYLPILEVLESLTRADTGESIARTLRLLAPTWYVQIVSLSTEDSSAERVLADARTASQERMKRELIAFLEELCRTRPVILFLEDVHWADLSTVDLLAYIGTKLESMRLLIVATYRPTQLLLNDHVFERVKLELQRRGRCHVLSPDLLTRGDIEKYVALEFPGHRFPVEFADLIHARTGGSPLFMVDLVRLFRDQGVAAQKGGRWELVESIAEIEDEIPESVRSMVQKKIDQISDDDRRLLTAASVQGHEFEAVVVARALVLDEVEVEERLERLDRVHALVRPVGEHEFPDHTLTVRYAFVHSLYQNSLYGALSPARRVQTSESIAETLLKLYGERAATISSELALLFEASRDFARASDHFAIAARNAAALHANQEAVELTRKAIANAERLQGRQRHERVLEAALQLGRLHMTLSRFEDAATDFGKAEKAAQESEDRESEVIAICGFARAQLYSKRLEEAVAQGRRALELARTTGSDVCVASAEMVLGGERLCVGALAEAEEYYDHAVWFRWRHNTRLQAELAIYWILRGSLEPATRHATSCLQTAKATQSPKYIAWAHKVLGDIASLEDRVEDARREYGIALQTVEAHPCPTTHWRILKARADLAMKLKDNAAAERFQGQARKVAEGLADSIRDEPLRQKFLTSEAVREL